MITRWIPWKFLIHRAARSFGIIDPVSLLAQLRRFAQPSEVQEPIELLRAGIIFHARGLINTKAIQHNLDWVWPYWVEKQFNPDDPSFIPRAFSFSHVNLTHRNWTAVGHPDMANYPVVDPRGLITPFYDGWSIDFWILSKDKKGLFPSRHPKADQRLVLSPNLSVITTSEADGQKLETAASVTLDKNNPFLDIKIKASSQYNGWIVVSLRPYNPEGIQFIETISFQKQPAGLLVNDESFIQMNIPPERVALSNYDEGDVLHKVYQPKSDATVNCRVGMATAAALFPLSNEARSDISLRIPLDPELSSQTKQLQPTEQRWENCLSGKAGMDIPDQKFQFLFDAAERTLVLLSADDIVPGPYTYKRFWFRDACLMIHGLLVLGFSDRSQRLLNTFISRQKRSGYFQSQEGEWDSNGQVLWIFHRFYQLTRMQLGDQWQNAVIKGVDWIRKKRCPHKKKSDHPGLLPAGFSAEHLGPNDFYYWDNFWAIAGLRAAAELLGENHPQYNRILELIVDYETTVWESIVSIPLRRSNGGIPASPHRRMDAGAIGSLVADYPLQLSKPDDPKIKKTIDFLVEKCFHSGGFFQDMIHSGINAYLTLAIAQSMLRMGDHRYIHLVKSVADLASPTGQWPEAIHPITKGGCMGDGQHGWAAAEWIMMMRNLFIREEEGSLYLGSGIFPEWLASEETLRFGPTLTPHGPVELFLQRRQNTLKVTIDASWFDRPPPMIIQVPGYTPQSVNDADQTYTLTKI